MYSANFPVISITLRENLKTLSKFLKPSKTSKLNGKKVKHDSSLYALAAIVPPILIALITEDVSMLVGFTGAYAGLGIQVFITLQHYIIHKDHSGSFQHALHYPFVDN